MAKHGVFTKASSCFESATLMGMGIAATLIMFANSAGRYLFGMSFFWAEEAIRILFVWSMFIAITYGFARNEHIGFTALAQRNRLTRRIHALCESLSLVVVGGIIAYHGAMYLRMTGDVPLPATGLPTGIFLLPGILAGLTWTVIGMLRLIKAGASGNGTSAAPVAETPPSED